MPKAYKVLFAADSEADSRRKAFGSLLEAVETDWIGAVPSAIQIPNRRRAILTLYALLNGSCMDGCADQEIERLIKALLPSSGKRLTHALTGAAARYAAV